MRSRASRCTRWPSASSSAQDPADAVATLEQLWRSGAAASVDLLGEATVTAAEADRYAQRCDEALRTLARAARALAAQRDCWISVPRVNLSVKVTALTARVRAEAPELGIEDAAHRLRKLLKTAKEVGAHLHVDMESMDSRELITELVIKLLNEPEFKDGPSAGIVLQAYLRDADEQLDHALGLIAAIVVALAKFGYSSEWLEHSTPQLDITSGGPGWLAAYTAFLGVWIMMLYTFDYGSKGQPKDQRFHQNITFGPVFYFLTFFVNGLIGIFLIIAVPGGEATETGIAGQLVALLGLFGVFVVFASQTRINTANYFMSASNLEKLGSGVGVRLPGLFWTILAALIIFALMMLPVIEHMLVALAWQGVLVSGWVAIGVAHILLDRLHSRRPEDGGAMDNDFHGAHWPGLIAWVVSAAVGIGLLQAGTPWGAIAATTIGPVLAFGLYLVLRIASGRHSGYRSLPSEDQTVPSSRQ